MVDRGSAWGGNDAQEPNPQELPLMPLEPVKGSFLTVATGLDPQGPVQPQPQEPGLFTGMRLAHPLIGTISELASHSHARLAVQLVLMT